MTMTKFSLQRVLDLKEHAEQAVAVRLKEARAGADAARRQEEAIEARREAVARQRMDAHSQASTVGHLQNVSYVLEQLERQLREAQGAVRSADARVSQCLAEYHAASRERKVLDRLRERHQEAAQAEAVQADRKTMDGVALSRFTRGEGTAAKGEGTR
jgi:flagellar protein FliJ